jgi:hypothetical protein
MPSDTDQSPSTPGMIYCVGNKILFSYVGYLYNIF